MSDLPPDPSPLSGNVDRRLRESQFFLMNEQSRLGLLSNPIIVVFIFTILWPVVSHDAVVSWLAVWGIVFIIRMFGYFRIRRLSNLGGSIDKWLIYLTVSTTLYSLMWGLALFIFWPAESPVHQLLLTMPLVAMVAAGAAAYAPMKRVAQLFVLALLIPMIIRYATFGGAEYMAISALAVLYVAVSQGIIRNLNESGAKAVLTSFENQDLADTLRLKNADLEKALGSIKALSGMLPICANCKKIRDDQGYYQQIEHYITEHSEAEFTHGICPDCAKELYPDVQVD